MKLTEVLSDRQQVWTIGGETVTISRARDKGVTVHGGSLPDWTDPISLIPGTFDSIPATARRYAAALAAFRSYEVRGEARSRKVTPGEMLLLKGAVAWLGERASADGCVVTWGDGCITASDSFESLIVHDSDSVEDIFSLRMDSFFESAAGNDLAILTELVRTSEVQSC